MHVIYWTYKYKKKYLQILSAFIYRNIAPTFHIPNLMDIYIFCNIWNIFTSTIIKIQSFGESKHVVTDKCSKRKKCGLENGSNHLYVSFFSSHIANVDIASATDATGNVLIKECSIAESQIYETSATNVHTQVQLYDASRLRLDTTTSFFRQFIEERARSFSFHEFQPSSLTPFMRERRVRAKVPLDFGELARDVRRKKRSDGERWERRAETTMTRDGDGTKINAEKRSD